MANNGNSIDGFIKNAPSSQVYDLSEKLPFEQLIRNIQSTERSLEFIPRKYPNYKTIRHNLEKAYIRVINENPLVSCDGNFLLRLYNLHSTQLSRIITNYEDNRSLPLNKVISMIKEFIDQYKGYASDYVKRLKIRQIEENKLCLLTDKDSERKGYLFLHRCMVIIADLSVISESLKTNPDFTQFIDKYQKAIAILPTASEGYFQLGLLYFKLKQYYNGLYYLFTSHFTAGNNDIREKTVQMMAEGIKYYKNDLKQISSHYFYLYLSLYHILYTDIDIDLYESTLSKYQNLLLNEAFIENRNHFLNHNGVLFGFLMLIYIFPQKEVVLKLIHKYLFFFVYDCNEQDNSNTTFKLFLYWYCHISNTNECGNFKYDFWNKMNVNDRTIILDNFCHIFNRGIEINCSEFSKFIVIIPSLYNITLIQDDVQTFLIDTLIELSFIRKDNNIYSCHLSNQSSDVEEQPTNPLLDKQPIYIKSSTSMIGNNNYNPLTLVSNNNNMYTNSNIDKIGKNYVIVVDVCNVAIHHGKNKKFSLKGIDIAINYFENKGNKVIGFVPKYLLDKRRNKEVKKLSEKGKYFKNYKILPENIDELEGYIESGKLISTPAQDYDDSYIIQYAMEHEGLILTNDMYKDCQIKISNTDIQGWMGSHLISYAFVGDELMINPDFYYP